MVSLALGKTRWCSLVQSKMRGTNIGWASWKLSIKCQRFHQQPYGNLFTFPRKLSLQRLSRLKLTGSWVWEPFTKRMNSFLTFLHVTKPMTICLMHISLYHIVSWFFNGKSFDLFFSVMLVKTACSSSWSRSELASAIFIFYFSHAKVITNLWRNCVLWKWLHCISVRHTD